MAAVAMILTLGAVSHFIGAAGRGGPAETGYHLLKKIPLGGEGGWDYLTLDLETHQVFLATAEFGAPPAATPENPHPRPSLVPGSFVILVFGK